VRTVQDDVVEGRRGVASERCLWLRKPTGHAGSVLLSDSFRIWEDFMWNYDIVETHLLRSVTTEGTSSRVAVRSDGTAASNRRIRLLSH